MGRAKGEIIVGVRCEIKIEGVEVCEEGIATVKVKLGRQTWIIEVYINDLESNWKRMKEWIDRTGEERIILGGDFNARTAERGGRLGEENEREAGIGGRRSKDKKANKEGLKLNIKLLEDTGLVIWNGNVEGDWEGEFTFAGERGARSLIM